MAQLSTKVKAYVEAAGKTVDFTKDVILQDDSDGKGPYIKEWNIAGLAKPTDSDLAAHDAAGDITETNNGVRATRKRLMVILAISLMRYIKISTHGKCASKRSKMQTLNRKGVNIE